MKYEKALQVYNQVQEQLKVDPTAPISGEYVQAEGVLKAAGYFSEGNQSSPEEAPVVEIEETTEEISEESQEENEND